MARMSRFCESMGLVLAGGRSILRGGGSKGEVWGLVGGQGGVGATGGRGAAGRGAAQLCRGDGVEAAGVEGVAAEEAAQGEQATLEGAVLLEGAQGISGAGGIEAAVGPEERGEQRAVGEYRGFKEEDSKPPEGARQVLKLGFHAETLIFATKREKSSARASLGGGFLEASAKATITKSTGRALALGVFRNNSRSCLRILLRTTALPTFLVTVRPSRQKPMVLGVVKPSRQPERHLRPLACVCKNC